jgi:chromosome segregation ATPase
MRCIVTVLALALVAAMPLAGCASGNSSIKRSVRATTGLDQTRAELTRVIEQITATMDSLTAMQNATGDLKAPFQNFVRETNRLSSDIDRARARFRDMRDRAEVYIAEWQAEVEGIQNEEIRAISAERSAQAQKDWEHVEEAARLAGEPVDPFMQRLTDIQTALANDLTAAGVEAMHNQITEANTEAARIKRRVGALQAEIDALIVKWQRQRPAPAPDEAAAAEQPAK